MYRFAILALALVMMSCGGDSKKEVKKEQPMSIGTSTQETKKVEKEQKGVIFSEDGKTATIDIEGDDAMKFNLKELKVKEGQKVTLTLHHVGKMGIQVMGHNWVLLKPGVDMMKFGADAAAAEASDYIPEGSTDFIVHTDMIGGGEKTTITFDAPAKGSYDFICSFPGHVALMKGKFIVE